MFDEEYEEETKAFGFGEGLNAYNKAYTAKQCSPEFSSIRTMQTTRELIQEKRQPKKYNSHKPSLFIPHATNEGGTFGDGGVFDDIPIEVEGWVDTNDGVAFSSPQDDPEKFHQIQQLSQM